MPALRSSSKRSRRRGIDPFARLGCCVVAPGIVDSVRGEYVYPIWSPSWGSGLPIIADLKARLPFAMDMQLENNSRIGGYVEGSNCKSDSYVSVISIYDEDEYSGKQGIGGSVVNHHAVRHGAGGYVGEFGHLTVDYGDEEICLCGRKGCLQVMVSAMRLLQNVQERREKYPDSPLWEVEKAGKIRIQQIFDAANAGDPLAMEVMDMAIEYYARAIEHIILTIDPAVIYIGGAYTNAGEYFRKGLNERVRHAGLFGNMNNLEICYSITIPSRRYTWAQPCTFWISTWAMRRLSARSSARCKAPFSGRRQGVWGERAGRRPAFFVASLC